MVKLKINDFKTNNNKEISMGLNNYFEDNYKIDSFNDLYLNLEDINKEIIDNGNIEL